MHCYDHQSNLILEKAASRNTIARVLFISIFGIPSFFSNSPQRTAALARVFARRASLPSNTRWNFIIRSEIVVSHLTLSRRRAL